MEIPFFVNSNDEAFYSHPTWRFSSLPHSGATSREVRIAAN